MSKTEANMTWTKTLPTEPGYYFLRMKEHFLRSKETSGEWTETIPVEVAITVDGACLRQFGEQNFDDPVKMYVDHGSFAYDWCRMEIPQ